MQRTETLTTPATTIPPHGKGWLYVVVQRPVTVVRARIVTPTPWFVRALTVSAGMSIVADHRPDGIDVDSLAPLAKPVACICGQEVGIAVENTSDELVTVVGSFECLYWVDEVVDA